MTSADQIVFAIGDIHGCLDLLDLLLERISTYADRVDKAKRVVVFIGDYVDRGPQAKGVVERVMSEPLPGFRHIALKGNHETMMLNSIRRMKDSRSRSLPWIRRATDTSPNLARIWFKNGGLATIKSYCPDLSQRKARRDFAWVNHIPASHLDWMASLPLSHTEEGYLFVHAGIQPHLPLADQQEADLLWIRDPFLQSKNDYGFKVVHGHTPNLGKVDIRANRINVDTDASRSGVLGAIALHDGKEKRILVKKRKRAFLFR